jgi:hypothetical protein
VPKGFLALCSPRVVATFVCDLFPSTAAVSGCAFETRMRDPQAPGSRANESNAADAPLATGRLLDYTDMNPMLKGRQAEVRGGRGRR